MVRSRLQTTDLDDRSSQFSIEPLDPGFGYSIGSALRRVLLSSIEGYAVTAVLIDGVQHEFSTLPGLREDITELVLRLKEVRFIAEVTKESWEIELHADKPGDVTAAMFKLPAGLQVTDPHQVLAHLDDVGTLNLKAVVEKGVGFVPAHVVDGDPIGTIRLDANFSPVERVAYEVGSARVGQRTDYDKLLLSVYTDGTRSPQSVIDESVKILVETLGVFSPDAINNAASFEALPVQADTTAINAGIDSLPVEELELGVRAFNCLKAAGVETLGDLLQYTEADLANVPNFGKKSFQEVLTALDERGLSLQNS